MNCEGIRYSLMNYIDGELTADVFEEIKQHLSRCPACKKFEETLRRTAIEPFKAAEKLKAPDEIWLNVKSAIEARRAERLLPAFLERLTAPFLTRKKPAFALAAVVIALLFAAFLLRRPFATQNIVNSYLEEQVQFLSYLNGENELTSLYMDDVDLGTAIEKYLF